MDRRDFVVGGLGAACFSAVGDAKSGSTPTRTQPNILLIVAEDLSPRIGCYGDPISNTPNIDRLAREGVRHTHVFTTSPVCAPSRAALMTGMHQESIGAQHMRTMGPPGLPSGAGFNYQAVPPDFVKAFPELLRAEGYITCNAFKTDYQFGTPFTIWDFEAPEFFNWRKARNLKPDAPFFAMINLQLTHESYIWPTDKQGKTNLERAVIARNQRDLAAFPARTNPASVNVPPFLPDTPIVRKDIARFYDNIAAMDSQVGQILDALRVDGLENNTIVIWTSDHGDGLPHGKRNLYDGGLHVPFIVRYPDRFQEGTVSDELISFVDLAPSLVSIAGGSVPSWMQGRRVLGRRPSRSVGAVFAASDRMDEVPGKWRSVRTTTHQFLVNEMPERPLLEPLSFRDSMPTMGELWRLRAEGGLNPLIASQFTPNRPREELYDLRTDPNQIRNIAGEAASRSILLAMRRRAARFRKRVPDWSEQSERTMVEKRMWPELRQPKTKAPTISKRANLQLWLSCPTPGASIGFRLATDPPNQWRLWTVLAQIIVPDLSAGNPTIQAKAIRYGFAESELSAL